MTAVPSVAVMRGAATPVPPTENSVSLPVAVKPLPDGSVKVTESARNWIVPVVCAAASTEKPASNGRESSAAARTGRSRRTAEPAYAATPLGAEAGSNLSGVSGPESSPAEEQDSGGDASGRKRLHAEDADRATRRPGDPATRRPGDPATRRPGDPATRLNYTLGTLGGACQPPSRHDPGSRFPTPYSGGDIRPNPVAG